MSTTTRPPVAGSLASRILTVVQQHGTDVHTLAGDLGIDPHQLETGDLTLAQVDQVAHALSVPFESLLVR